MLRVCSTAAPENVTLDVYKDLGKLPIFNPDLEDETLGTTAPEAVIEFRNTLDQYDGLIISSPEYTHGITSVIKNAIDWVISSASLSEKPVALLNASPRATIAYDALKEILITADVTLIEAASIAVPLERAAMSYDEITVQEGIPELLRETLQVFASSIRAQRETE